MADFGEDQVDIEFIEEIFVIEEADDFTWIGVSSDTAEAH